MDVGEPHVGFTLLAEQLLVIRDVEDRNAKRTPCGLELLLAARPPHAMSPDYQRPLRVCDQIQNRSERGRVGPCAGNRPGRADERALLPSSILVERENMMSTGRLMWTGPG